MQLGIEPRQQLGLGDRHTLLAPAAHQQHLAKVAERLDVVGAELGGTPQEPLGLDEIAGHPAGPAIVEEGLEEPAIQRDRPLERGRRLVEPAIGREGEALGSVRLRQVWRELQGPAAVGQDLLEGDVDIAQEPQHGVAIGDARIGPRIAGIDLDRAGEELTSGPQDPLAARSRPPGRAGLQVDLVGVGIEGRPPGDAGELLRQQPELERRDHPRRNLVLQRKDVADVPIVPLGPEMAPRLAVDELGGDAKTGPRLPDAALQDVGDAQPTGELDNFDRLPLEGERRVARYDEDGRDPRQVGDDVLGYAVAEILLLRVAAHVGKGQDDDRRLARRRGRRRRSHVGAAHAIEPDRLGDVLQGPLAEILEGEVDLAADLGMDSRRDEDAAGLGLALQARSDIDAIAVEIAAFDDHVTEVDPDPQDDAAVDGPIGVGACHGPLQLARTGNGLDRARELDQRPVAQQLDDTAAMAAHQRLQDLPAAALEQGQRARLVGLHQPGVADDVGSHDRSEPAHHRGLSHRPPAPWQQCPAAA
ncbi:MAG: hypothetical protein U1E53_20575 [Dongiaceae bacterium]